MSDKEWLYRPTLLPSSNDSAARSQQVSREAADLHAPQQRQPESLPSAELGSSCAALSSESRGHQVAAFPIQGPAARPIQAKLTMSQPGDRYEQEADRVADEVMRVPEPSQQPLEAQAERQPQMQPSMGVPTDNGQGLPGPVRAFMEPRFNFDFGAVRIHADTQAHSLARSVNAKAFTVGGQIVFGAGTYSPDTASGRRLLAHELTHVVQQHVSAHGQPSPVGEVAAGTLQRAADEPAPAVVKTAARRVIMIDADVLSQINRGNQPAAAKLKELTQTADVWISQEAYNAAVVNRSRKDMGAANRLLLDELNIKVGPPESMQRGALGKRVDVYDKNIVGPTKAVLSEQLKGQPNLVGGDVYTAAQAKAANAEVWSFDRAYRNNAQQIEATLGVRVAPESQAIAPLSSPAGEDWRVGRQLLGLQQVEIQVDGTVGSIGSPSRGSPATPPAAEKPRVTVPKLTEAPMTAPKVPEPTTRLLTAPTEIPRVTVEPDVNPRALLPRAVPVAVVNPDALHPVLRILRDLIKVVFSPTVLVPVSVLLELLNAVQMYAMAMGGLSGAGFVFQERIARLRGVVGQVEGALSQYAELSDQLEKASTTAYVHSLAGRSGPNAELCSLVADLLPKIRERLADWSERRRALAELQQTADRQRKTGEQLLASKEFHQLTAPMGTVAAATVLSATQDMITICALAGDAAKVLDQLIALLQQDLERAQALQSPAAAKTDLLGPH
jgi:hypothetical protein